MGRSGTCGGAARRGAGRARGRPGPGLRHQRTAARPPDRPAPARRRPAEGPAAAAPWWPAPRRSWAARTPWCARCRPPPAPAAGHPGHPDPAPALPRGGAAMSWPCGRSSRPRTGRRTLLAEKPLEPASLPGRRTMAGPGRIRSSRCSPPATGLTTRPPRSGAAVLIEAGTERTDLAAGELEDMLDPGWRCPRGPPRPRWPRNCARPGRPAGSGLVTPDWSVGSASPLWPGPARRASERASGTHVAARTRPRPVAAVRRCVSGRPDLNIAGIGSWPLKSPGTTGRDCA